MAAIDAAALRPFKKQAPHGHGREKVFSVSVVISLVGTVSRKSSVVALRCHILKLKCTKFDFGWGSATDPAGELTALPRPPSWI